MPSDLDRAIADHRRRLLAGDQKVLDALFRAYAPIRQRLAERIDDLTAEIGAGGATTGTQALKLDRARALFAQVTAEMDRLAAGSSALVTEGQRQAVNLAAQTARAAVLAQDARLAGSWNRAPTEATRDLVGRLGDGSPLGDWLDNLGEETSRAIRDGLTEGMATGANPRAIAKALQGTTDVAGSRLLATARTAILGSYRSAAIANYAANQDVLEDRWEWISAKSKRTCAACLALDGTKHKVSDGFQKAHVNCRCSSIPIVKGAKPTDRETGREWLANQDAATQDGILGKEGGARYRAGNLTIDDFVTLDRDKRWGDSYRKATLGEARVRAGRRVGVGAKEEKATRAFDPASTIDDARDYARSLGVSEVDYGDYLPVANMVNDGLTYLANRGLGMPKRVRIIDFTNHPNPQFRHPSYNGLYDGEWVSFNADPRGFLGDANPARIAKLRQELGFSITDDPRGVVFHETGHALHGQFLGRAERDKRILTGRRLTADEESYIREKVSRYATTNPQEFVAEVFTGRVQGIRYDDRILGLYDEFGGPPIP